jgi:hypothetical protein
MPSRNAALKVWTSKLSKHSVMFNPSNCYTILLSPIFADALAESIVVTDLLDILGGSCASKIGTVDCMTGAASNSVVLCH